MHNQHPVMLLSSAPVHRGNSGGVLVDTDGHFAGLVTGGLCMLKWSCVFTFFLTDSLSFSFGSPGNGKTSTGRTITHLNFAIPLEAMTDAVNAYLADEDRQCLEVLNSPPTRVDDIWSLRGSAPVWEPLEKGELHVLVRKASPGRMPRTN